MILKSMLKGFLWLFDLAWAFGALMVCGLAWMGWLFTDTHTWTQWLSFIPAVFVVGFAMIWLFLTLPGKFRIIQLVVFITAFAALGKVLMVDMRWNRAPRERPESALRMVHWNTAHGIMGTEAILRTLAADDPDICLITEPPRAAEIEELAYYALGMKHIATSGDMTLASHFPLKRLGDVDLITGKAWSVLVETSQGPLEVVCVDMISRPNLNRHPPLSQLARWIETNRSGHPLLLVGDFNTPRNAASFRPLRALFRHAYEQAGSGWPYSWPVFLPLYAIDHLWLSPEIEPLHYTLKATRFSDHKSQIVDFRLPPPPER